MSQNSQSKSNQRIPQQQDIDKDYFQYSLPRPNEQVISLLTIIAKDIAYFIEEEIKDTPTVETLEEWDYRVRMILSQFGYNTLNRVRDPIGHLVKSNKGTKSSTKRHYVYNVEGSYAGLFMHVFYVMSALIAIEEGMERKDTKQELLEELYSLLEELNSSGILAAERMRKLGEAIQGVQPLAEVIPPAARLWQAIEQSGAHKMLDPRRQKILQTYLTTETPIPDLGKLPEVGLRSRSRLTELLHSGMEVAFYNLPPNIQAEYDNDPMNALRTRSTEQTNTKSERLKQAHSNRKNPDTNKIEFSATHKQRLTDGNLRRWQRYHEQQAQVQATSAPDQP